MKLVVDISVLQAYNGNRHMVQIIHWNGYEITNNQSKMNHKEFTLQRFLPEGLRTKIRVKHHK